NVRSHRCAQQKRWQDSASGKIDSAKNLGAVLRKSCGIVAIKLERQTTAVLNAPGDPEARLNLIDPAREKRIALVLRVWEVPSQLVLGALHIVAEEETAGHWKPHITDHVRVTDES